MGLRLFFLPNFPGAMFIQGGTFIPESRVTETKQTSLVQELTMISIAYKVKPCEFQ